MTGEATNHPFLWGLLGFVFAVLLPGLLALRVLGVRYNPFLQLPLAVALSAAINYALIIALVAIGAYQTIVMRLLALVMVAALVASAVRDRLRPVGAGASPLAGAVSELRAWHAAAARYERLAIWVGGAAAFAAFLSVLNAALGTFGTIFTAWDPILVWNIQALEWAKNASVVFYRSYPQLVPALYSVSYVILGDPGLQFFAKAVAAVFPAAAIALALGLALQLRSIGHLFATAALFALIRWTLAGMEFEGYADMPVAFMAFASFACLLLGVTGGDRRRVTLVALGAFLAAACAHTKQVGCFYAMAYPVLLWILCPEPATAETRASRTLLASGSALAIGALVLPWYVAASLHMTEGSTLVKDIAYLVSLTGTPDTANAPGARLLGALSILATLWGWPVAHAVVPAALILAVIADRSYRWVALLLVIPFVVIWGAFFSYDQRNVALALPFLALCIGAATAVVWTYAFSAKSGRLGGLLTWLYASDVASSRPHRRTIRFAVLGAAAVAAVAVIDMKYDNEKLYGVQWRKQWGAGEPEVNEQLRMAVDRFGAGPILTNYPILTVGAIPALRGNAVATSFASVQKVRADLERSSAKFILVRTDTLDDESAAVFLESLPASGEYELLYRKTVGRPFLLLLRRAALDGK